MITDDQNNIKIRDSLETGINIAPSKDLSTRFDERFFQKISNNRYKNKNTGFLHIIDIPLTSETIHEYSGAMVKRNLLGHGAKLSDVAHIRDDERIYVGNPIEEVAKALPSLRGMKMVRDHNTVSLKNPRKSIQEGYLIGEVRIDSIENRPTAICDELVVDSEQAAKEMESDIECLSVEWNGKFVPIEKSPYAHKKFTSNRWPDKVATFVKMDLESNHLAHVIDGEGNDEFAIIPDSLNNNNQGDISMEEIKGLLEKISATVNGLFTIKDAAQAPVVGDPAAGLKIGDEKTEPKEEPKTKISDEADPIDDEALSEEEKLTKEKSKNENKIDDKALPQYEDMLISKIVSSVESKMSEMIENKFKESSKISDAKIVEQNEVNALISASIDRVRSSSIIRDSALSNHEKLGLALKSFGNISQGEIDSWSEQERKINLATYGKLFSQSPRIDIIADAKQNPSKDTSVDPMQAYEEKINSKIKQQ